MKYSYGYDEISTKILKLSIPYISSLFTYMCNRVISTGVFPTRLKFSEINPMSKKAIKVKHLIIDIFLCLRIFKKSNKQFEFRKGSSTELASYNLISNELSGLNNKLLVGGVFYDSQNAFDCVNCDILLSKMECYCITGKSNNLIKSHVQDRFQRVIIDHDSRKYTSN
jgi:hypothetical protein